MAAALTDFIYPFYSVDLTPNATQHKSAHSETARQKDSAHSAHSETARQQDSAHSAHSEKTTVNSSSHRMGGCWLHMGLQAPKSNLRELQIRYVPGRTSLKWPTMAVTAL